jgi:hypothetical protein
MDQNVISLYFRLQKEGVILVLEKIVLIFEISVVVP